MTLNELQLLKRLLDNEYISIQDIKDMKSAVERDINLKTMDPRKAKEEENDKGKTPDDFCILRTDKSGINKFRC